MLLAVDSVAVRYRGGALGVSGVSLEVGEGQIVALFGANGAGKTTTVRAISGFLRTEGARVVSGGITFAGRSLVKAEPHQCSRRGIAVVPERNKVFRSLTVAENLAALAKPLSGRDLQEAMGHVRDLFPVLEEKRSLPAGRLSGGQQQMLSIARALLTRPRLLLLDEMTLGLHESLQDPLFEAVGRIREAGTSVLLVDESTAKTLDIADHGYLLGAGRVIAHGSPDDLRGQSMLLAGYEEAS